MNRQPLVSDPSNANERMWPLDVGLGMVGTLVGYTIVSQLRFDDPRLVYNAWTYVVLVPVGVIGLSLLSRLVASRFVEKSAQLGFLASVLVHLLLLLMAVNVIVFGRYFPEAFTGSQAERVVKQKTVPDYLFSAASEQPSTPDWSKPVEAETSSKTVPIEQRLIPPVENTSNRLEMPTEQQQPQKELEKFLVPRQTPESAMPMPADTPGQRSKNLNRPTEMNPSPSPPSIIAPVVPVAESAPAAPAERSVDTSRPTPTDRQSPTSAPAMSVSPRSLTPDLASQMRELGRSSSLAARAKSADSDELPRVGQPNLSAARPAANPRTRSVDAAGAAPATPSIAVARVEASADRQLSPAETPMVRTQNNSGASLGLQSPAVSAESSLSAIASSQFQATIATQSDGVPNVSAGSAGEATSRRTTGRRGLPGVGSAGAVGGVVGLDPSSLAGDLAGAANASAASSSPSGSASNGMSASDGNAISDRLSKSDSLSRQQPSTSAALGNAAAAPAMQIDLNAALGVGGLGDVAASRAGVSVALDAQPEIGAVSLRPSQRRRLDVGGPIQPVGSEVASIESFKRRVMRTRGSGAPTPAGVVGPETEEAIERGLRFLASRQLPDGHWSLQGHGEPVLLRSDTAATGLCLLAFQGAGYTHLQHQYSNVVSNGLRAMLAMQQPDGNLYRREDAVSDQNVAFYSHGIAALALCEAFGMTGDESLRKPAQAAINYIVNTQHKDRGGWRYQPQVSSDTSVSGWMMMALKSGELAGLDVPPSTYAGIDRWLDSASLGRDRADRYRYNPFAPDTPSQRHGRDITPSMTAVAILMRMYAGWRRETPDMQSAADYLAKYPPAIGDAKTPYRDTYYWYYATQVMFHMGGKHWDDWNQKLKPILIDGQIKSGPEEGSWDPKNPVPDRWSIHAGRLYLTTMNLLSLEVYYRHLPIYEDAAK